jgi:predicted KAP-like P-loop ATPase
MGQRQDTVYVLVFDIEHVAKAVAQDLPDGLAYIEKIVQVAHEIPAVAPETLTELLAQRLGQAVQGIDYRLNPSTWQNLFGDLRGYFSTTREIVRYCNQVRGLMALLAGEVEAAVVGERAASRQPPRRRASGRCRRRRSPVVRHVLREVG